MRSSTATLSTLLSVSCACQAGAVESATAQPAEREATAAEPSVSQRELETRFMLALSLFERGAYEDAAQGFAQLLLDLPQDASADDLRHLLIQHVAWARIGSYDVGGDASTLDEGEDMLERYLVRHERLLPDAAGERESIYALLAEFQLRRDQEQPRNVHDELSALTRETADAIAGQRASAARSRPDAPVWEIEVDTIPWARLDDPKVMRNLRSSRYVGVSLFNDPGEPFNPTRVLVRGWVSKGQLQAVGRETVAALRRSRPALEACYENALGRGQAGELERVALDLRWADGDLDATEFAEQANFDAPGQDCLVAALREAGAADASGSADGEARLQLSFFIQPQRRPGRGDMDYSYFGQWAPLDTGDINYGAQIEGVHVSPWFNADRARRRGSGQPLRPFPYSL
ncbi:hypothetical protein [Plesiocystis pacifica]|nr:hypothetical protein [Plesiocystis pacifica]